MNNIVTKSDLKDFEKEILDNLQWQLAKAKEELQAIKEETTPINKSTDELRLELLAKDEQLENLRNYHQICKKFAEERIPITTETQIINKSDEPSEYIEIQESNTATDGYGIQVVKKIFPKSREMEINVKDRQVSRGMC